MWSNSVCNHTHDKQTLTHATWSSDFVITCMITDRIGLHSVLLPILITHTSLLGFGVIFHRSGIPWFCISQVLGSPEEDGMVIWEKVTKIRKEKVKLPVPWTQKYSVIYV